MDPLTQGVFGSVAAQQFAKKQYFILATVLGFFSGLAPDLDILIRSDTDALLALEYHRQFTHSLFFIPFGGLLCAVFFYYTLARRAGLSFKSTWLFCGLGYATHGLLDACTTYGTQLLWPFSNARFAWNLRRQSGSPSASLAESLIGHLCETRGGFQAATCSEPRTPR